MRRNRSQIELLKLGTKKLYLSIVCFLQFAFAFAQNSEIVFTRLTTAQGLASTWVNSVLQDDKGYYWFGTQNGLQKCDGPRFFTYRHNPLDSASLPGNRVSCLMQDNKKRLWMSAGLYTGNYPCIFNPLQQNFKKIPVDYPAKENFFVRRLFQDSKGLIWMTTDADGLFVLDTLKNIFKPYTTIWPQFFFNAWHMFEDKQTGRYWLSTDKGVLLYDPKLRQYYHLGNNPEFLQCFADADFCTKTGTLYLDRNNVLWTARQGKDGCSTTYRYETKKNVLTATKNCTDRCYGHFTDATGTTWRFGGVLSRYDSLTNSFIEIPNKINIVNGIGFDYMNNMYEDKEKGLWAMTENGLYLFNPSLQYFTFQTLYPSGLKKENEHVYGFVEINDGHIIVLNAGENGLCFYDTSFNKISPQYGFNPREFKTHNVFAHCGLQDSKGLIWVGCTSGVVLQLNPVTKKVITLKPPELKMSNGFISSMAEDRYGNIWFGTRNNSEQNNTLVKWNRNTNSYKKIVLVSKGKFGESWIYSLLTGQNNDLWIGTMEDGLVRMDVSTEKITEQFLHDEKNSRSISSNIYIAGITFLNAGSMAIGTGAGIDIFDLKKKEFSHIVHSDDLSSGGVYSLINDGENNIWFASLGGISKVSLADKRIHKYKARDGVTYDNFNEASVKLFSNNKIAFGSTHGFVWFNPGKIKEKMVPSDVLISGFNIFSRSLSVDSLFEKGNNIQLNYSQNYITIQFASTANNINDQPYYYYMLEDIDKDWVNGNNYEAVYTYLPAGKYTFKVKCITSDGVPSKNITSFTIYIKPPFYQTWWFYTLCALLISAVIYTIYRIRIERLLALEKVRTRIASDLHDDMGSALSTINILSTMAKNKIADDPVTTNEYINKISENSSNIMESMSDIVWSINPLNDSMQKIVARMREFAAGVLEPKNIDYDFYVDEKVFNIKTGLEEKKDLFLIFKEAVNNLAKYSGCKKAWIELKTDNKKLLLLIKDDGKGFDVSSADNGNGMHNMRKRAAALKGKINIESEIDKGTQVQLIMPLV